MAKRKLKLEEVKENLHFDKIFYNGDKKFNVLHLGKYCSGITIEIPQEWELDKDKRPVNPINFREVRDLTDGMNIDFDGDAEVLFGKYRLSKNEKPVFEITEPKEAKDVMINVAWGGPFNKTRGQTQSYANETGATFFTRRSSNGGGAGCDYWILPVGFVKDREERNVDYILERIQKEDDDRIAEVDKFLEKQEEERQESIENKDIILAKIKPIVEEIKKYSPEFKLSVNDEQVIYQEKGKYPKRRNYNDSLVEELEKILVEEENNKRAKDEYLPQYQELEDAIQETELSIEYRDNIVKLITPENEFSYKTYSYSLEGFTSCIKDIANYRAKIEQEKEDSRLEIEKLKKEKELKEKKEKAKEKGYPEIFKFKNRIGGKTGLSHAYVIEKDGIIREPDHNELRNLNHRHHHDWKNNADGVQEYHQILPGEIIVSYTKRVKATPYVLNVEWADGPASEEQLESISDALSHTESFAVDSNGNEITAIEEWVEKCIELKAQECRKELKIEETQKENSEFLYNIEKYAKQRAELREKNTEAKKLTQQFEEQVQEKE